MICSKKLLVLLLLQGSLQASEMKPRNRSRERETTAQGLNELSTAFSSMEVDEKQGAAIQAEVKSIPVQVENFLGKKEVINIEDTEAISNESFAALVAKAKQNDDFFILARVVTQNDKDRTPNFNYYDAYHFNQWRFGNYPMADRQLEVVHPKNPLNNLNIQDDIQYFVYDPTNPEQGFTWAFSENNFLKRKLYRLMVEANQGSDDVLRAKAYLALGKIYYDPLNEILNFKEAIKYTVKAAHQAVDLATQISAYLGLGQMYYFGVNIPKNWEKAKQNLLHAISQNDFPWIKAQAETILGSIYFGGGYGVEQNYKEAKKYLEAAAYQNENVLAARLAADGLRQLEEKIKTNNMNDQ